MPHRQTVVLAVCALSLVFGHGARAQDDDNDGDDSSAAPVVVDINGPCTLTVKDQAMTCRGVAYMVFPSNHRIDFTAITETAGWAFSGEDDENKGGRYALDLDSVLSPASGRLEAQGRCEMQMAEDRRTVKSLSCRAATRDGEMKLEASGVIAPGDDGGDGSDDGPGDGDGDD